MRQQSTPSSPDAPPPPPLASNDAMFVTGIAQANLAEISEAQLALQTSKSKRIMQYAQQMVTDHTKLNDQLAPIAQAHGVTLPTTPDDAQQQQLSALQGLHGYAFNHAYVADQIQGHEAALQIAQTEASGGTDPALKQYAETGVPIIQSHLQMAQALAEHPHHMRYHHHHTTS